MSERQISFWLSLSYRPDLCSRYLPRGSGPSRCPSCPSLSPRTASSCLGPHWEGLQRDFESDFAVFCVYFWSSIQKTMRIGRCRWEAKMVERIIRSLRNQSLTIFMPSAVHQLTPSYLREKSDLGSTQLATQWNNPGCSLESLHLYIEECHSVAKFNSSSRLKYPSFISKCKVDIYWWSRLRFVLSGWYHSCLLNCSWCSHRTEGGHHREWSPGLHIWEEDHFLESFQRFQSQHLI